jgi:peptidoglycan/LPS O-acetylase OafA/YrhL
VDAAPPLAAAVLLQIAVVREFTAATGTFGFLNQTTSALLFGALIFASIVPDMPGTGARTLQNGLLNPVLRQIGKYSYAIYVVHIPIKYIWFATLGLLPIQPLAWQQIGVIAYNFIGVSILSTAVAFVSWHVLEQPFLSLKRHFVNRNKPPQQRKN